MKYLHEADNIISTSEILEAIFKASNSPSLSVGDRLANIWEVGSIEK